MTAREVCDRLTGSRERAYTTIMTTMDRLHRKRMLLREKDGLAWRYAASMTKGHFEKLLADALAAKLLRSHGDAGLAAFVDAAAELSDSGLDRLAALVAARKRGSRK